MNKVYRVEHTDFENGTVFAGPYSASGINIAEDWADVTSLGHGDDNHPPPTKDPLLKDHELIQKNNFENYYFGFKSLDQLKSWFSQTELQKLSELNYIIAEYTPESIIEGEKQLLFIPQPNTKRKIIE